MKKTCKIKLPCRKGWRRGKAKDMDPCQLKAGIKVEHEHFRSNREACRTAVDHLAEAKNYYTRLKRAKL